MKFQIFIIFCGFFLFGTKFVDGSARCLYVDHFKFGYTCRLSANVNLPENPSEIIGSHLPDKTDDDVVSIQKNKIVSLELLSSVICEKFKNVKIFNIPKSKITKIDGNAFKNCKNLQNLFLDENEILELPENLVTENIDLQHVSLMANNLTTLPENLFKNSQNLKHLSLMRNQINFLPENLFKNLPKLESIFLDNNQLTAINPAWLSDLENLKLLFMSENQISDLPKNVFKSLKNIDRIVMSGNNLTVIDSESFGMHNDLAYFDIRSNNVNAFDEKFFEIAPHVFVFDMTGNQCFSGRQLNVSGIFSEFKTQLGVCFDNFKALKEKEGASQATTEIISAPTSTSIDQQLESTESDLSKYDQILNILIEMKAEIQALRDENRELKEQQIEILKLLTKDKMNFKLFVIFCWIFVASVDGFTSCEYKIDKKSSYKCVLSVKNAENIEEIDGIHISSKSDDDIESISPNSRSNSSKFPSNVCEKFTNLKNLNLYSINIQKVDQNSLKNCENLRILSLSTNKIREIPENFFIHNSNLIEVDLSHNKLTNLPENLFENLDNLENLKLQKNNLSNLPENIFSSLSNLKILILTSNDIKNLNPKWFLELTNLHQLFLSFNKIEQLPPKVFNQLTSLKSLDLSVNNLTTIHADSFGSLPNLIELSLEYNNINSIDPKVIDNTGISIIDLGFGDRNVKVNLCVNKNFRDLTRNRSQLKVELKKCFENYQQRG
ncbi:toll-like receptor 13 [Chironomus tepperi]|uniref:toll-like receptor 13 n=1 Tax=Chironomus tepperi TaxID=113505 RepID=UPI00391F9D51